MKYDIFISYRRNGGYDTAKHLFDLLTRDGYRVSFDIDTLRSGDFDEQLYSRIDQCKDFILIVNQHAFDRSLDPTIDPRTDWLRCELAYALKKDKNIVPVFLAGTSGFPSNLPNDIIGIIKKNGPEYSKYHFDAFYEDLKKRFLKSKPYRRNLKIVISFLIVSVALATLLCLTITRKGDYAQKNEIAVQPDSVVDEIIEKTVDIVFYCKEEEVKGIHHNLYAKVDGYEYKVDIPDDICIDIVAQEDFDEDGVKDALIKNVQACGGNGIGNSFFFVTYTGEGYFSISNSFGKNVYKEPVLETWKGRKSVVIIDTNEGINTDKDYEMKERYILKQGDAVKVESSKKNQVVAMKEIRSSDFHGGKEYDTIKISYDLDGNGVKDYIVCTYFDRWDALHYDIIFNGKSVDCTKYIVNRIGVLSSKTKGVNDLLLGFDNIVRWDGHKYIFDNVDTSF